MDLRRICVVAITMWLGGEVFSQETTDNFDSELQEFSEFSKESFLQVDEALLRRRRDTNETVGSGGALVTEGRKKQHIHPPDSTTTSTDRTTVEATQLKGGDIDTWTSEETTSTTSIDPGVSKTSTASTEYGVSYSLSSTATASATATASTTGRATTAAVVTPAGVSITSTASTENGVPYSRTSTANPGTAGASTTKMTTTTTAVTPVNITGKCNQTDETNIGGETTVGIGCVFRSVPSRNLTVTCQKGGSLISSSDRIFYRTGRESGSFFVQLKFTPILRRDRGNYSCKASTNESSMEVIVSIQVFENPTVTLFPSTLSLLEGDQKNLTCNVTNTGAVKTIPGSLVWCRPDGSIIDQSKIVRVREGMEILMLNSTDAAGVYGCGVTNCTETATLAKIRDEDKLCPQTTDSRGTEWPLTVGNTTMVLPCPVGFQGNVRRFCDVTGAWKDPNYITCVREEIVQIEEDVSAIKEGGASSAAVKKVLDNLQKATNNSDSSSGDLDKSIEIVDTLVTAVSKSAAIAIDSATTQTFINVIDNILSVNTSQQAWKQVQSADETKAASLMRSVTSFGLSAAKSQTVNTPLRVNSPTLVMEVANITRKDIMFSSVALEGIGDYLTLPKGNFRDSEKITYVAAFYKTMADFLPTSGNMTMDKEVNSQILALAVQIEGKEFSSLNMNVSLNFHHTQTNHSEPACGYWDFDKSSWFTDGCTSYEVNETFTRCECDHLTNFAILMSPGRTVPEEDLIVLKIISIVGCSLSILGCVVTVLTHVCLWRYVRSSKSVILVNLCIALTFAYVVFLAGVERTENKAACTAVSAMLHYFFLAAFSLMFAQGVDIAIQVVHVFRDSSKQKILLSLAWGVPAVIVGITLGVTKLEGYGNDQFCWLTITDGVLYAFVGPVLFVILANCVIIIIIMRVLCSTKMMVTKRKRERAVTTVRSLCVLMPVLGVTWVFGVLAINDYTVIFQYLFAGFNSLQGFLIFIMHCLFNKAIIDGIRKAKARYDSNKTTSKSLPDSRNNWKHEEKKHQEDMTEVPTDYDSDDQSDKASSLRLEMMLQDNELWQKAAYNNYAYLPRPRVRRELKRVPSLDYSESSGDMDHCLPDYPAGPMYMNPVYVNSDDEDEPYASVLKIARPSFKTHL